MRSLSIFSNKSSTVTLLRIAIPNASENIGIKLGHQYKWKAVFGVEYTFVYVLLSWNALLLAPVYITSDCGCYAEHVQLTTPLNKDACVAIRGCPWDKYQIKASNIHMKQLQRKYTTQL